MESCSGKNLSIFTMYFSGPCLSFVKAVPVKKKIESCSGKNLSISSVYFSGPCLSFVKAVPVKKMESCSGKHLSIFTVYFFWTLSFFRESGPCQKKRSCIVDPPCLRHNVTMHARMLPHSPLRGFQGLVHGGFAIGGLENPRKSLGIP